MFSEGKERERERSVAWNELKLWLQKVLKMRKLLKYNLQENGKFSK